MQKQAPTIGRLAVICGFVFSCLAILIYLWVSFGGPAPLDAKGYRIKVPFSEATQLADQADVRIAGVSVGKVVSTDLSNDGRALATIEIEGKYSPIPADTRAILRAKTLLGETYVELSPGDPDGPTAKEGETLPEANVAKTVELDEILRTFDEPTRQSFQEWFQNAAVATRGRGVDLSNAIALLQPTFTDFDQFFRTLDTDSQAVTALFSNASTSLAALRGRQNELRGLITSGNQVFGAIGRRNEDLANAFRAFPEFLDQSAETFSRLRSFSENADPLFVQLTPATKKLSPALVQVANTAPYFKNFFKGLRPTANLAPAGLSNFRSFLREDFPPALAALDPFLKNLNPLIEGLGEYSPEITALFANATGALQATQPGDEGSKPHYIRTEVTLQPESVAAFPRRLSTNRNNAYSQPGAYKNVPNIGNFLTSQCSSGVNAQLPDIDPDGQAEPTADNPNAAADNNPPQIWIDRFGGGEEGALTATKFFDKLKQFAFGNKLDTADINAAPCNQQGPFKPLGDPSKPATSFQHALRQPNPSP